MSSSQQKSEEYVDKLKDEEREAVDSLNDRLCSTLDEDDSFELAISRREARHLLKALNRLAPSEPKEAYDVMATAIRHYVSANVPESFHRHAARIIAAVQSGHISWLTKKDSEQ